MGKIKSALELAMEKTADMKIDKAAIRNKEARDEGRRLAAQVFAQKVNDPESILKKIDREYQQKALEGFLEILCTYIKLPTVRENLSELEQIKKAFLGLKKETKVIENIFGQLSQLFEQFLDQSSGLRDNLAQQYLPVLKQKEEELYRKTGQRMELRPEQDPEFMRALDKNLLQLKQQYQQVVVQAREQLSEVLQG